MCDFGADETGERERDGEAEQCEHAAEDEQGGVKGVYEGNEGVEGHSRVGGIVGPEEI